MSVSYDIPHLLLGGSLTPETFFADHWERRWAWMRGAPDRFAAVFDPADLGRRSLGALVGAGPGPGSYRATYYDRDGIAHVFGAPLEMAEDLLAAGMTLQFTQLEQTQPRLAALAAQAAAFLGARTPITVDSFLSPDDHGFPWHLDNPHVFVLQIEGAKRWRLGRTRVAAAPFLMEAHGPRAEATLTLLRELGLPVEPPRDDDCDELVLSAGDVLYLPPGTWHRASAVGRSCHVSLLVRPLVFGRLLRAVIATLGIRSEAWRADLQRMDAAALRAFLRDRLDDARRQVEALTSEHLIQMFELLATSPLARLTLLDRARDTL